MTWAVLVRTVGWSLAVGVATGALARVAMRGVAEATNGDPEFTVGATVGIVTLFVMSAVGSGVAGMLRWPIGFRLALSVASTGLVALGAVAIGIAEIVDAEDRGLTATSWTFLIALTVGIVVCVVATPIGAWILGHRERSRALT